MTDIPIHLNITINNSNNLFRNRQPVRLPIFVFLQDFLCLLKIYKSIMDLFDVKNKLSDLFGNKQHRLSIVFNNDGRLNGLLYMVVLFEDELVIVKNKEERDELNESRKSDESNRIHLSDVKEIYEIIGTGKLLIYSSEKDFIISKAEYDKSFKH